MAARVTLDAETVRAVRRGTNEEHEETEVRPALTEHLHARRLRRLLDLAGTVDLRYTNDELERLEGC